MRAHILHRQSQRSIGLGRVSSGSLPKIFLRGGQHGLMEGAAVIRGCPPKDRFRKIGARGEDAIIERNVAREARASPSRLPQACGLGQPAIEVRILHECRRVELGTVTERRVYEICACAKRAAAKIRTRHDQSFVKKSSFECRLRKPTTAVELRALKVGHPSKAGLAELGIASNLDLGKRQAALECRALTAQVACKLSAIEVCLAQEAGSIEARSL